MQRIGFFEKLKNEPFLSKTIIKPMNATVAVANFMGFSKSCHVVFYFTMSAGQFTRFITL